MKFSFNIFKTLKRKQKQLTRQLRHKDFEKAEPIKLSEEKILKDMEQRHPTFDLRTGSYWRQHPEEFLNKFFGGNYTTNDIRVPEKFREWVVGQSSVLQRIDLLKVEWLKTLKMMQETEKKNLNYSAILKERPTSNLLLIGSPGTGKCITSSTPVLMGDFAINYPVWIWEALIEKGYKPKVISENEEIIENPDIYVMQMDKTGELIKKKVRAMYKQKYNGKIVRIITSTGRYIDCTPNHRLLTTNGWMRAGDIKEGMKVIVPALNKHVDEVIEIKETDYKGNYVYDFEIDSDNEEEKHYICGHNGGFITHNSLLIKVFAEGLRQEYEKEGIELEDVVLTEDKANRYQANVRYLKPAGIGRKLIEYAQVVESQKQKRKNALITSALVGLVLAGFSLFALGIREMILLLMGGANFETALASVANLYFGLGLSMIGFPLFLLFILRYNAFGVNLLSSSTERLKIPNLIVDNDPETTEMYENATIISDALLFGEIEWDPLQTPGLGMPPYRRAKAGLVHKANKKILYIDELRNLTPSMAVKLLTVMEDGATPIRAQGQISTLGGSSTAGQNLETPPIKSFFFLFAAANNDMIEDKNSIINQFPALRDRFENYGDIIYLQDEVEATPYNKMLICQAVTDEIYRFGFPPMESKGVEAIIDFIRDKASNKNNMRLMFRTVIKVIKKSAQLAWNEGYDLIKYEHVINAIQSYSDSIEHQMLTKELEKTRGIKIIKNTGTEIGVVNGLGVIGAGQYHEGAGNVIQVQAFLKFVPKEQYADYVVTGITEGSDIKDSIREVRTAIQILYGIDIAKHAYTHIRFSQTRADGPSAGITMLLALMSILGDPDDFKQALKDADNDLTKIDLKKLSIPLRQDVAVTGALEVLTIKDDIKISAVGGILEKIDGARRFNIKHVIIPKENYDTKQVRHYKDVKVLFAETALEYFNMLRGDFDED